MRLYTYYSDEFEGMSDMTAASAYQAGFDVHRKHLGELQADCDTGGHGFANLIRQKVEMVLDAINECRNEVFVFADADVHWYGDANSDIAKCLIGADIAFQCDWWGTGVKCQGLFVARANARVQRFFEQILSRLDVENTDQSLTNDILSEPHELQFQLLPRRYWTQGASTGKRWEPGDKLFPPRHIKAHHANWVVGYENKMELLQAVKAYHA